MPYGAPPNIHEAICSAKKERAVPKIVSFADRKAHAEGFRVSFMAENSMPFTLALKLVEFAHTMSSEPLEYMLECECVFLSLLIKNLDFDFLPDIQ